MWSDETKKQLNMESAKPVNGEEMCIYISCFCEASLSSFSHLCSSFVNKAKSGKTGGWGGAREDEVERKGKMRRHKKWSDRETCEIGEKTKTWQELINNSLKEL